MREALRDIDRLLLCLPQGYDIDKWPGMPFVGPASIDEMNARIDQAEQEMDHDNGFSWDQVMLDAQTIVNRYAKSPRQPFGLSTFGTGARILQD